MAGPAPSCLYLNSSSFSPGTTVVPDLIIVRDLLVRNIIGVDNWERQKKQDVIINLRMESDISAAGETDELAKSVSYSTVAKEVAEFAETKQYKSVEGLAEGIANLCLTKLGLKALTVRVEKPRALLLASSAGVEIFRNNVSEDAEKNKFNDRILISDLLVRTIIGVNPWERDEVSLPPSFLLMMLLPRFRKTNSVACLL